MVFIGTDVVGGACGAVVAVDVGSQAHDRGAEVDDAHDG